MVERRVRLTYPLDRVDQPIIHQMIQQFGLQINIHRADVNDTGGWLIVDLRGEEGTMKQALDWVGNLGIAVEDVSK